MDKRKLVTPEDIKTALKEDVYKRQFVETVINSV